MSNSSLKKNLLKDDFKIILPDEILIICPNNKDESNVIKIFYFKYCYKIRIFVIQEIVY